MKTFNLFEDYRNNLFFSKNGLKIEHINFLINKKRNIFVKHTAMQLLPLQDSQAFPPAGANGSELPLLLPLTTPLLLLIAAGFGLLLKSKTDNK